MQKHIHHKLDVYTELYPASSVAIIGTGLIAATMGEIPIAVAITLTGIAFGLAVPVVRAVYRRRTSTRPRNLRGTRHDR